MAFLVSNLIGFFSCIFFMTLLITFLSKSMLRCQFLFVFSLDMFMIFFIGFLGLWNNEIDFSIFLLPIFLLKLTISHVEGQVQWYISLISVFFAWAHLIIEFSLCLLTYCFFPVMILLTIFSFVLVMGFSFLDTLLPTDLFFLPLQPKPSLKIGSVNNKAFLFWYWQRPKSYFF